MLAFLSRAALSLAALTAPASAWRVSRLGERAPSASAPPPPPPPPPPYPRLCAGNLEGAQAGAHTATIELMTASSFSLLGLLGGHAGAALPPLNSLQPLPGGMFKGFQSSLPGRGFFLALWAAEVDLEGPELSVDTSTWGMAILREGNASCTDFVAYAWTEAGLLVPGMCFAHAMPPDFAFSGGCVGEGTMWDAAPVASEAFEGFPVLDFTSAAGAPCTIRKRVDLSSGCVSPGPAAAVCAARARALPRGLPQPTHSLAKPPSPPPPAPSPLHLPRAQLRLSRVGRLARRQRVDERAGQRLRVPRPL